MYSRLLQNYLIKRAEKIPVLAILGPRQSGKTTLARSAFPKHVYISLENFEEREFALNDPNGFLEINAHKHGIILDEIQHTPKLLSYIQTLVDAEHKPGYFILTGSQNLLVNQAVSQSLAGRVALFTLLPFSIEELRENNLLPEKIEALSFTGGYPRIYAYQLESYSWYQDYIETYVEKDVRQIGNVINLSAFRRFIRLCAGRVGQILNIVSLANDCGIDQRTAKAWLSILEATYIIFLLQPHYENFSKRLIKSPKLYFYDTGLACALLDIKSENDFNDHYLRGNIIECLIISEIYKHYYNSAERANQIYFWRNHSGNEIDCVIQKGSSLVPIEIKAGKTINSDFFKGLAYWAEVSQAPPSGYVIYGGSKNQQRKEGTILSWQNLQEIFE